MVKATIKFVDVRSPIHGEFRGVRIIARDMANRVIADEGYATTTDMLNAAFNRVQHALSRQGIRMSETEVLR